MKTPSAFMSAHTRGTLHTNPPKAKPAPRKAKAKAKATRKATAKRKASATRKAKPSTSSATITATRIGEVSQIKYRRDGKTFVHDFKRGIVLAFTDTDKLIIAGPGLRVRPFIED